MKPNMLRLYSRSNAFDESEFVFSYLLSITRSVIGNAFGILASRFRIFRRTITAHIETAVNIAKACVALHNFFVKEMSDHYLPSSITLRRLKATVFNLFPIKVRISIHSKQKT